MSQDITTQDSPATENLVPKGNGAAIGKSPLLFSFPEVDGDLFSDLSYSAVGYQGLKEVPDTC